MFAYAITDPSTFDFDTLHDDIRAFASKASMIVYRDKEARDYEAKAVLFLAAAKGFKRVLLHTDYHLAARLQADGVHLQSTQLQEIEKAKRLGLFVIVSTHSVQEAELAQSLGADMVTFSPVFHTPNKAQAVGIERLKEVVEAVDIPVIALGGVVSDEQIELCRGAGAEGFASIRYFAKKSLSSL